MSIKEMPLQDKYDKLYDYLAIFYVASYAFNKEQGTVSKWPDYFPKMHNKMMPSFMGPHARRSSSEVGSYKSTKKHRGGKT